MGLDLQHFHKPPVLTCMKPNIPHMTGIFAVIHPDIQDFGVIFRYPTSARTGRSSRFHGGSAFLRLMETMGSRTGEGRRRKGGKARRTGARKLFAAPQRPMAWLAEAQAGGSPAKLLIRQGEEIWRSRACWRGVFGRALGNDMLLGVDDGFRQQGSLEMKLQNLCRFFGKRCQLFTVISVYGSDDLDLFLRKILSKHPYR
jgi:hypothetical protein